MAKRSRRRSTQADYRSRISKLQKQSRTSATKSRLFRGVGHLNMGVAAVAYATSIFTTLGGAGIGFVNNLLALRNYASAGRHGRRARLQRLSAGIVGDISAYGHAASKFSGQRAGRLKAMRKAAAGAGRGVRATAGRGRRRAAAARGHGNGQVKGHYRRVNGARVFVQGHKRG